MVIQTPFKYKQYDVQHLGHEAVRGQVHHIHSSLDGCDGSLQMEPGINTYIMTVGSTVKGIWWCVNILYSVTCKKGLWHLTGSDWPNYQLKMRLEWCGMFVSHLFFMSEQLFSNILNWIQSIYWAWNTPELHQPPQSHQLILSLRDDMETLKLKMILHQVGEALTQGIYLF